MMILIVGGRGAGKRNQVKSLGYADADIGSRPDDGLPVLVGLQAVMRTDPRTPDELAELLRGKKVVTCDEVGCGIVPVDAADREWRDRVGRICALLARDAETVIRMCCGIPQYLKGTAGHPMRVLLLRHAPTKGNLESRYMGATDEPLSETGVELAGRFGADPSVDFVVTSGLQRTRRTAELIYPNAKIAIHDGLDEMNFGRFENKNWQDLEDDPDYIAWLDSLFETSCPGGEDKDGFINRCRTAFQEVLDAYGKDGELLRVVTHGGVIMSIMNCFVRPERDYFYWRPGFCEGYCIESTGDGYFRHIETISFPSDPVDDA